MTDQRPLSGSGRPPDRRLEWPVAMGVIFVLSLSAWVAVGHLLRWVFRF